MRANERLAALTQLYFGGQLGQFTIGCRGTDDECCERQHAIKYVARSNVCRESRDFNIGS